MAMERDKLPKTTAGDNAHTIAKAVISAVPVIGGPATELFSAVVTPPLTRRRDAWLQSLADGLEAMEEKLDGFTVQSLVDNEEFVTMVMEASCIAIRNHSQEKIEFLRNAVLNSAVKSPDEYLQCLLLQFIDAATPWHFRVLSFYRDPESFAKTAGLKLEVGDLLSSFVERVFTELKGKDAFRLQIERDLLHYGLVLPESAWYSERTTNTGVRVLQLIKSPLKGEASQPAKADVEDVVSPIGGSTGAFTPRSPPTTPSPPESPPPAS